MEIIHNLGGFHLRVIMAIVVIILFSWSLIRSHQIKFRDVSLYLPLCVVSVFVLLKPSIIDQFLDLGRIRTIPLGAAVVWLLFAQLFWLAAILILRERSHTQIDRYHNLVRALSAEREMAGKNIDPAKFHEIMVVLPAYREEDNIAQVLEQIPEEFDGHAMGVLVVVDGLEDPTYNVIRNRFPNAIALRQFVQIGQGAALQLGYRFCAANGVRIVVSMDADGQHSPEDLSAVLQPVLSGEYDIVIGSRIQGGWVKESLWRFVGLHLFGFLIKYVLGVNSWDCTNNYRAFLLKPVMKLGLVESQYQSLEFIFKAHRAGLRIGEAPVRVLARSSGTSKKGSTIYYGYQFLKRLVRYTFRK